MLHKYFKLFFYLITIGVAIYLSVFISGCAKTAPAKTDRMLQKPISWQQHQKQLMHLERWRIQGKISLTSNKKGHSANFIWAQNKLHYDITALTPIGTVHAHITGSPAGIRIIDADNQIKNHNSAEKLLEDSLGWHVPIKYLAYWIKGLSAPHAKVHNIRYNDLNIISSFEQASWKINYLNYAIYNGMHLPQLLKIEDAAGNKIKLFINSWETN